MFDAYAQFEELSLSKKMEEVSQKAFPTDDGWYPSLYVICIDGNTSAFSLANK